jgi:hypothetical protein
VEAHRLSTERAHLKKDYSEINSITYGLLSVDAWKNHIKAILTERIQDFTLNKEQEDTLRQEISVVLNALITKADNIIQHEHKNVGSLVRRAVINAFVNIEDVRKQVPEFSQTIIDEIQKPENRKKLQQLAEEKLNELAAPTNDSTTDSIQLSHLLAKSNRQLSKTLTRKRKLELMSSNKKPICTAL